MKKTIKVYSEKGPEMRSTYSSIPTQTYFGSAGFVCAGSFGQDSAALRQAPLPPVMSATQAFTPSSASSAPKLGDSTHAAMRRPCATHRARRRACEYECWLLAACACA